MDLDWSLCIICQKHISWSPLKCPKNSKGATPESTTNVYNTFISAVKELRDNDVTLDYEKFKFPSHITANTLYDNAGMCSWQ